VELALRLTDRGEFCGNNALTELGIVERGRQPGSTWRRVQAISVRVLGELCSVVLFDSVSQAFAIAT